MTIADAIKDRIVRSATGLFAHAAYPLANTLDYDGDPGLFGPGSATWQVIGDIATFVGGLRALLVQAAHPEVVAGVFDHSQYREDPLGRLSRTSSYVTATAFGAMPEVERAIRIVRGAHRPVSGTSHRGMPYAADTPELAAWVHNALTDSFLTAYQVYGPEPLTRDRADLFVTEQTKVGAMLEADPMPSTANELSDWIERRPEIAPSPGMYEAVAFLRSPPLQRSILPAYRVIFQAAVATLPDRIRTTLGLRRHPGAVTAGRALTGFLRWSMGASPTWHLALVRAHADIPEGLFRQPLGAPIDRGPSGGRG
jgi:uncharacterized protein (DUF2236 family)